MNKLTLYAPDRLPAIDHAEVLRQLGYGEAQPDQSIAVLIEKCADKLLAEVSPRCVYTEFPIIIEENGVRLVGCNMQLLGRDITAHLNNCHTLVLMAATLTAQSDRLISWAQAGDLTAGFIMDSCATVSVEQFCDDAEREIKQKYSKSFFTTRYSPGYGDFPLELQREFLTVLDAPRKIGLCATDSSMLTPRKSVTAVIGVGNTPISLSKTGCDSCRLRKSCAIRIRGEYCGLSKSS